MRLAVIFLICAPLILTAQTSATINALNTIVDYANQSADEISTMSDAMIRYHASVSERRDSNWPVFSCPVQQEEFYYNKAVESSRVLGAHGVSVSNALNDLREVAGQIDARCKNLDTYHKLDDHRKDGYTQGKKIFNELLLLLEDYHVKQRTLGAELGKHYANNHAPHSYDKAVEAMRNQLDRERRFIDLWKYNLMESGHTAWIEKELSESILETAEEVKQMEASKPDMKYPASAMWPSFVQGMKDILSLKRSALDGYNHEAKKTDRHANQTYMQAINYYNGVLVSHYNTLLDYAKNDKFFGLKAIHYVPVLETRTAHRDEKEKITSFKDESVSLPAVKSGSRSITKNEFGALDNYITFINESFRQLSHQRDVILNLSSRAAYFASLTSYAGKGTIQFSHDGFSIPRSHYERAIAESKLLDPALASVLNTRAGVLLGILQELDQIGIELEEQTATKSYEEDGCKELYVLMERISVLYNAWDERKELLYNDLETIYESFPPSDPGASWVKSGVALRNLAELDRVSLFTAKRYYKNESTDRPETERIEAKLREVLSEEYNNLKGIQKLGRSNGLCPYTPYEDLPKVSKALAEKLGELKPARPGQTRYQHPYHDMVYHYNDVVRYLNKFCELSPAPLLKSVFQPELFQLSYPQTTREVPPASPAADVKKPEVVTPVTPPSKPVEPERTPPVQVQVVRDTVYIERRDTVYLAAGSEDLRSMEGYASNNLVLLLDVSGSMNSPEKLPLLKESILKLLDMMREEDQIAIVVFSGKPNVLLKPVSFRSQDRIRKAIQSLKPSGKTDANAGLKLAYKVADENYMRGGNNRILLATDGEFGINEESRKLIAKFAGQDIFLSVFNFGKANSTSANLRAVAGTGGGVYQFISRDNVEINLIREVKAKRK